MKRLLGWIKRLGKPPKPKRKTPDAHTFALREVTKKQKLAEQAQPEVEPLPESPKPAYSSVAVTRTQKDKAEAAKRKEIALARTEAAKRKEIAQAKAETAKQKKIALAAARARKERKLRNRQANPSGKPKKLYGREI